MDMEYTTQDVRFGDGGALRGVRKRLMHQDGTVNTQNHQSVIVPSGLVAGKVLQIEAGPTISVEGTVLGTLEKVPGGKVKRWTVLLMMLCKRWSP